MGVLESPVTLVRGGGGFGKTTLLCTWAHELSGRASIAWLSLDEYDASATELCELVDSALRGALPGFGRSARVLLDRGIDDPRRLAAAISNELFAWSAERERGAVLFLDDVQFVTQEAPAVAFLGEFLRALPQGMHVVLASRAQLDFPPLGKLRATNALREIDQDALRFTREEASSLLEHSLDAAQYFEFTEGWPMALGLVAHILRAGSTALGAAKERTRESLFEFLAQEVVARLPVSVQRILFCLSAATQFDAAAAKVLGDVEDVEAFVSLLSGHGVYISQGDAGMWRLHTLFRDFLIEQFKRNDPPAHRAARVRYAQWLREQGRKTEALEQLLDAGEYEEIVPYVSEALVAINFSDRYNSFIRLLSTVPDPIMRAKPMLHRFYARALMRAGDNETADVQLQRCYERALEQSDYLTACAAQLELGILADRFYFLRHGTFARSEACFRTALELAQRPEVVGVPIAIFQSHWHLGMVYAARGDFERAFTHLDKAEAQERNSERHVDPLFKELAIVHGWRGDWRRALEYAELAEDLFRSGGGEFWIGNALLEQARAHTHLRDEPSRAIEIARLAIRRLDEERSEDDLAEAHVVLGQALLTMDPPALDDATAAARGADEILSRLHQPAVACENALLKCGIALIARDQDESKRHIDSARRIAAACNDPWHAAMVLFYEGAHELAFGRDQGARERFDRCMQAFEALHDQYNAVLAQAAFLACDARAEALDERRAREFFARLRTHRLEYAMRGAPQSAGVLLGWALRHEPLIDDAAELLADGGMQYIEPVLALARDASAPAAGRVSALGIVARRAPAQARAVLTELAADDDPAVASSARAIIQFLPSPAAAPMSFCVVGEFRVRIGDAEFGQSDARWGRRRAAELLHLLAIAGPSLGKNAILAALWPDNPSVTDTTLRVALHAVRRALQPEIDGAGDYVDYDGTMLRLRPELIANIDAVQAHADARLAQLLRARGDTESAHAAITRAVLVFSKAPREEDAPEWLRPFARTWREAGVSAYLLLFAIERERGRMTAALEAAEGALSMDNTSEDAVCALLDAYLDAGKAESARRTFLEYRRRLSTLLDTSPGPAVMERYARLAARTNEPKPGEALSDREREVLALIARGMSNKQIAAELDLSPWTVNNHVAKILRKLNVESRTAAVAALSEAWSG